MEPAPFPRFRPRRLRRSPVLRDVVADVRLSPDDLIYPLFVSAADAPVAVSSMPGVEQLPVRNALDTIRSLASRGLRQFILFGVTPAEAKDAVGSYARHPDAPVNRLLKSVRDAGLDVVMHADLCFCEYTDHGHCGPRDGPCGDVDNDATLELLGPTARVLADCGADVIAPSGMMDGMVGAIRSALDDAGRHDVAIMSYAVKYASSFYGPFREAGGSGAPGGGQGVSDRKGYQMDYRRSREWRTEVEADVAQGADIVMVKPALAYLDIIRQVRDACALPVAAYQVSGEYAMLHAAAARGWLDLRATVLETTYAIKRAGADWILTYFAPRLLEWLEGKSE